MIGWVRTGAAELKGLKEYGSKGASAAAWLTVDGADKEEEERPYFEEVVLYVCLRAASAECTDSVTASCSTYASEDVGAFKKGLEGYADVDDVGGCATVESEEVAVDEEDEASC